MKKFTLPRQCLAGLLLLTFIVGLVVGLLISDKVQVLDCPSEDSCTANYDGHSNSYEIRED